ncbi:hypothetical protein AAY473_019283 [Plecturocebus cupreus]
MIPMCCGRDGVGDGILLLLPRLKYNGTILAHCNLRLPSSSNSPASTFQVVGIAGAHHHKKLAPGAFFPLYEAKFQYGSCPLYAVQTCSSVAMTLRAHHEEPVLPDTAGLEDKGSSAMLIKSAAITNWAALQIAPERTRI